MVADPNKVRLTGENSFLVLSDVEGGEPTVQNSHWRVLHSPKGPGHVLFTRGALTDDKARIYADNPALARWLQEGIQGSMRPTYDGDIPIIESEFAKEGDTRSYWIEHIESAEDSISLTWYDFLEPVVLANAPGENPAQPHGVYTVLIPAGRAQMTLNGRVASGRVFRRESGGREIRTSCLALSETWTIPWDHAWAKV